MPGGVYVLGGKCPAGKCLGRYVQRVSVRGEHVKRVMSYNWISKCPRVMSLEVEANFRYHGFTGKPITKYL